MSCTAWWPPGLIKLDPAPKQIFAGNAIQRQLQNWLPRWQQLGMVSGLSSSLNPSDTAGGTSQREMQLEDQLLVLRKKTKRSPHAWACRNGCCGWWPMSCAPLTAANLALQSYRLEQIKTDRFFDVMDRRLEDIEQLSHDLLEVGSTRWEALFNPQRLSLAPIAAEAILELEKLWVNRRLELLTDVPSDLPDVYADQRRMRQVILNLLENALKFTPDGGQVSLKLLHRTSQWVQVSVSDSGPGIPTEEQQRIFQDRVGYRRRPDKHQDSGLASRSAGALWKSMAGASGWSPIPARAPVSTSPCRSGEVRAASLTRAGPDGLSWLLAKRPRPHRLEA